MVTDAIVVESPFTVAVDTREQKPWTFKDIQGGPRELHRPLKVLVERKKLDQGDYSIIGLEDHIAIERKSLEDCFNSCGQGRKRFEREHQRMAELDCACVFVEGGHWRTLKDPPARSRLKPKIILNTASSWFVKYGVPWFFIDAPTPELSRRVAMIRVYRLLDQFWRKCQADIEVAFSK